MNSVVLIRFGALGDTLMLTPLIRYLSRHFGMPVDYAGRGPWSRPLLEAHPDVGGICEIYSKRLPYALNRHQRAMVRWLRERREGLFIDLEADAVSAGLLKRAGVPEERIWRTDDIQVDPHYSHQVHKTLARLRMRVEGLGRIEDLDTALEVPVPEAACAEIDAWLAARGWAGDALIVLAPGNKRTMSWRPHGRSSNRKHWPVADWGRLCDLLLADEPAARILVIGAPVEQRLARRIAAAAGSKRVHAVANEMNVSRLLALLRRARGAIVLDSGPSHAAAAVGCPVVTLFQATNPAYFRPLSRDDAVRIVTPGGVPVEQWRPGVIDIPRVYRAWCELRDRPPSGLADTAAAKKISRAP